MEELRQTKRGKQAQYRCKLFRQRLIGLLLLLLSALMLTILSGGGEDAAALLLTVPAGVYLLLTKTVWIL